MTDLCICPRCNTKVRALLKGRRGGSACVQCRSRDKNRTGAWASIKADPKKLAERNQKKREARARAKQVAEERRTRMRVVEAEQDPGAFDYAVPLAETRGEKLARIRATALVLKDRYDAGESTSELATPEMNSGRIYNLLKSVGTVFRDRAAATRAGMKRWHAKSLSCGGSAPSDTVDPCEP